MALGRTCKPKGKSLPCFIFKEIPRGSLLEKAVLFRFGLSQISQQLRLGNQAHAPTQTRIFVIFPWANISSTRRVKGCIRGTCKAWTKQLFIISMIRAYTNFHTYVLGVLFKAWNIFSFIYFVFLYLFYFILFWIFERLKPSIFFLDRRWKDRLNDLPGYSGIPPQAWMKLSRSTILNDFFLYAI